MVRRLDTIGHGGPPHAAKNLLSLLDNCGVQGALLQLQNSLTKKVLLPSTLLGILFEHYPAKAAQLLGARTELVKQLLEAIHG